MSLFEHARAARTIGEAFGEAASDLVSKEGAGVEIDQTAFRVLAAFEDVYLLAAGRLEEEARAAIRAIGGACTMNHEGLKGPQRCLACGAGKS